MGTIIWLEGLKLFSEM